MMFSTGSGYSSCNLSSRDQQCHRQVASCPLITCCAVAVGPDKLTAARSRTACNGALAMIGRTRNLSAYQVIRTTNQSLQTIRYISCSRLYQHRIKLGRVELVSDSPRNVDSFRLTRRTSAAGRKRLRDRFVQTVCNSRQVQRFERVEGS